VAVAVDRPKVAVVVRTAMSHGQDVVNFVRFADAAKSDAVVTPAEVLIALQYPLTDPAPGPATAT